MFCSSAFQEHVVSGHPSHLPNVSVMVISGGRKRLLQFPSCFWKPPRTGRRHRLTTQVSAQIDLFEQGSDLHSVNPLRTLGHSKLLNLDEETARLASVKSSDGDVHGAIRMLASDDSYVVPSIQALDVLRSKHPPAPPDRRPVPQVTTPPLQCYLEQVLSALHSFWLEDKVKSPNAREVGHSYEDET